MQATINPPECLRRLPTQEEVQAEIATLRTRLDALRQLRRLLQQPTIINERDRLRTAGMEGSR